MDEKNNIKIGYLIVLFCAIGLILGLLIGLIKKFTGIESDFVSGGLFGGGIVISIFYVNKLIKNNKMSWIRRNI